jgi:hypothetical protein
MKDKKYFCYEIYKNLAIWSYRGKLGYTPCSLSSDFFAESKNFDLNQSWSSTGRQQIKIKVETDQPIAGCQSCYDMENAGIKSRRNSAKELYEVYHNDTDIDQQLGPTGLDYSVGNLCNLKCVICSPNDSTSWIPDYQKLYPGKSIEIFSYNKHNQLEVDDPELLKNLKSVHFHGGGEPLLTANHLNLLKKIDEVQGLHNVRVFYNTNGTVRPSQEVLDIWKKCKLIEIYFSIDDVCARFEYQRTGASWPSVLENLMWYYDNMPDNHMFNINCVWSYLNLYYLDELVDWYTANFSNNRYGDPVQLIFQQALGPCAILCLSSNMYSSLMEKFKDYPQLTRIVKSLQISDSASAEKFLNYINKLDTIRGNDFHSLCPEWSKLLT